MTAEEKSTIQALPYITVQADLQDVISDVNQGTVGAEDFWVSCYRSGQNGVHGKVRVTPVEGGEGVELEARDGITCQLVGPLTLVVSCLSLSIPPTKILLPRQVLRKIQPKGVDCLDVAGDVIATGGKDGALRVDAWRGERKGKEPCYGRGHVGDLTSLSFLTSGKVLLSSSSDLSARIFSALPTEGSPFLANPRVFAAPHTRAVSAAAPIGKGRFVATACRDGVLRIWEVKDASVVAEGIWEGGSSVGALAMTVVALPSDSLPEAEPTSGEPEPWPPRFVSSLSIALALSSGRVHLLSLPSLKPLPSSRQVPAPPGTATPLDALAFSSDGSRLAVGSGNGVVTTYNVTFSSTAVAASWRRTEAGINSLVYGPDGSLIVAGSDGLPYRASVKDDGAVSVEEEWAGFDTDPVNVVRLAEGRGFAAGSDGAIRVY